MASQGASSRTRVLDREANTDGTIGGSYYSLLYLIEGLKETEYEPVAVFYREHRLLPNYREACAQVHVVELRPPVHLLRGGALASHGALRVPVLAVQRALNFGRFLLTVRDCATVLRRERIDLLHLNNSVTRSHEWMLAARMRRIPCVVHERGVNRQYSRLTRLLAPRLASVICISESVRATLLEHGVSRDNLRVIYNGLDPARVAPTASAEEVRRRLGIDDRRRVIGVVGNIKAWKGQEVMVGAMPAIAARVPEVACLLVGATSDSDREYEERLRRQVAEAGLGSHVLFTGPFDNVADVLNVMEVAVHTSVAPEPFGRVLLEAMAMRKPVVGSHGGAVPEIVEEGVTGWTFEPGDPAALAGRALDLLLDRGKARDFGEAGFSRLARTFHVCRNVESTLSLYREILGRRGGDRSFEATASSRGR